MGELQSLDAELFIEPVLASWVSFAHLKTRSISLFAVFAATTIGLAPGCRTATSDSAATDARVVSTKELVGRWQTNHIVTPVNQILTPAGLQVDLPEMRPQALVLSPDGRLLVTAGKTSELVLVDPVTGKILQKVPLPSDKATDPAAEVVSSHILDPDKDGQLSFTGLIFSPDGKRIYLSNVNGSIKVFDVSAHDGVDPWPAANEPDGCERHADVRLLYDDAGLHAIRRPAEQRAARRVESGSKEDRRSVAPPERPGLGEIAAGEDRSMSRGTDEPHSLARDERLGGALSGMGCHGGGGRGLINRSEPGFASHLPDTNLSDRPLRVLANQWLKVSGGAVECG